MEYQHLLGRPYVPGKFHCFAFARDFYMDVFGISIRNYACPNDWDAKTLNIMEHAYEKEGFEKVQDWTLKTLHPGDVLVQALGSPVGNHCAIYVGGNMIAHHLIATRSREETLRDYWRKSICYVLRHPDVVYEPEIKPQTDIMEILRERNKIA